MWLVSKACYETVLCDFNCKEKHVYLCIEIVCNRQWLDCINILKYLYKYFKIFM